MFREKVTATDIAKKLNISRATMDRVLNNRGMVADQTRERILNAVKELGYTPNRAAKHLSKKTQCRIGVSHFLPDWFGNQINSGIAKAFGELRDFGATVIVRNATQSVNEQIEQIREMLPEIDALAVAPWEPSRFEGFIDELVDQGLPVATFNIDVPSSKRLFYVGSNYIESGRLCGELITKFVSTPGEIGIITYKENLTSLEQRIIGFREVLSGNTDFKIIGPFKTSESKREDLEQIKQIIQKNPDLAGIFVANQDLGLAGIAVRELGKTGRIKLVGFDLNDLYKQLILESAIYAVVCQEPFYQGYYPIKILFDFLADGRWPSRTVVNTRLEIVMRENLKYYYDYQPVI
jgi:LacI family transcriptional regulator